MKIRPRLIGCFVACLAVAATGGGEASPQEGTDGTLPGVWFLDAGGTDAAANRLRLVVGGAGKEPPASPEQICLGWSWRAPAPNVDPYPGSAAGTFLGSEATWSLTADGETIVPESCRSADSPVPFPGLGLGPADELWLLAPEHQPARRTGWVDLLHTVEAAYRQSTTSPLAEMTIGALGRCAVRSLPVASDTRLDRWSPVELPRVHSDSADGDPVDGTSGAGPDGLIRARRFLWWVEPPAPGESCGDSNGGRGTLRLFPVPAEAMVGTDEAGAAGEAGEALEPDHFFAVSNVEWRRLRYFDLDADDWSPHLRSLPATVAASDATEPRKIALATSPEQRQQLLSRAFDLCAIEGLAELCRRNVRARRQLYTAIQRRNTQTPWPDERLRQTQDACRSVLAEFRLPLFGGTAGAVDSPDACANAELWQRPIAGELVAGFSGEILVAGFEGARIRETWRGGAIEWQLESRDPELALTATPVLELRLLDGSDVRIATRDLLDPSLWQVLRRHVVLRPWRALAAGAFLAALVIFAVGLRLRRLGDSVKRLEGRQRALRATVRKNQARPRPVPPEGGSRDPGSAVDGLSEDQLRDHAGHLVADAVETRLRNHAGEIDQQVNAQEMRLSGVARQLAEELRQESATLGEELRGALRHEAQSLSEALRQDSEAGASPYHLLCRELAELEEPDRTPLSAALKAAGRLGDWIGRLWPIIQAAAGCDVKSIPKTLPGPAADEWQRAVQILRAYRGSDAVALRALGLRSFGAGAAGAEANGSTPDSSEVAFLDNAGLLAGERPFAERLKRYLEPFDHPGRLSEVTLALQYLVEAYPIEQLAKKSQRRQLRGGLAAAHDGADPEDDFHHLVAQIAAGVGLRYRPVPYYKSRTDQSEYAFVRQQVSPISLSERVGFKATTETETIVRLERPFFAQLSTGIYYAGHAHVARD